MVAEGAEVEEQEEEEEKDADAILSFVEAARLVLLPDDQYDDLNPSDGRSNGPGWGWILSRILMTCASYSSGVTPAILFSELAQAWNEHGRYSIHRKKPLMQFNNPKDRCIRRKTPNTITIDSIYEKNFLPLSGVLEAIIVDVYILPETSIYMLTLGDFWSSNTIDIYLHRRYYNLMDSNNAILKRGREILLTGCYLRNCLSEGSGRPRLLPTEYLLVLLDEDEDDDAMLLGAQFCSDVFSSISLDSISNGASFAFYSRIDSIDQPQEKLGSSDRVEINLVDSDGDSIKFVLWGEQVVLADLIRIGNMLALDNPFISSYIDGEGLCLEYGSATHLYLVPNVQHNEQVSVAFTQNQMQESKSMGTVDHSPGLKVSQLMLPRDSQGSVDFTDYPFRSFVMDLRDKMSNVSIYGVVKSLRRDRNHTSNLFILQIEDPSGTISVKLHFRKSWSLGRLSIGHTVFLSGLTCAMTTKKCHELLWFEDADAQIVNISSLPALLNSSCLYHFSLLSHLSSKSDSTKICRIWVNQIEHCHVNTRFSHYTCGSFVEKMGGSFKCKFCECECESEVVLAFQLKIVIADSSAKAYVWCVGPPAAEILQISPLEFCHLHEEEQVIYPSSLEKNEMFVVALVNCSSSIGLQEEGPNAGPHTETLLWEIVGAQKCFQ